METTREPMRNWPPQEPAQRAKNGNTGVQGAEIADKIPRFGAYLRKSNENAGNIDKLLL